MHDLPPSPTPTLLAPLLRPDLIPLLDSECRVQWSFDSTLAVKLLTRPRALLLWKLIIAGPYGKAKLLFWIAFVLAWMFLTVAVTFKVGATYNSNVITSFIVFSIGVFFILITTGMFFFDTRIVRIVVRSGFFISNMSLAIVAVVSTDDVWRYDERSTISGMLLCIVAFVSLIDSFPPELRRVVGVPMFVILLLAFFSMLALLAFARFPESQERIVVIGTVGGLATSNLTMSVRELAADSTSAFVVLCARMMYHVWQFRNSGYLIRLQAPVRYYEDPDHVMDVLGFLDFLRAVPQPMITTKFIPVLEPGVARLLDPATCRIKWSSTRTLLARLIGHDAMRRVVDIVHGGTWTEQVVKFCFAIVFMLVFVITTILTLFDVIESDWPLIVTSGLVIVADFYVAAIIVDLDIFLHAITTFDFWLQLSLAIIGATAMCLYWNFSPQCILAGPFFFLILFVASIDATFPGIRETLGPFVLVVLLIFYMLMLILVQLGHFPHQNPLVYNFGTFGGISTRPLTVDVQQTLSNVFVGQMWLFVGLILSWWESRHDRVLNNMGLRLVGAGDPHFVHFPMLRQIQWFGLGTTFEQSRRISSVGVSDNPLFLSGDDGPEDNNGVTSENKVSF